MVSYLNLGNYYKYNFALMQHHNYDQATIDSWYPFERDLYVHMLQKHIEEVEKAQKKG